MTAKNPLTLHASYANCPSGTSETDTCTFHRHILVLTVDYGNGAKKEEFGYQLECRFCSTNQLLEIPFSSARQIDFSPLVKEENSPVVVVTVSVVVPLVLIICCIVVILIIVRRRRKDRTAPQTEMGPRAVITPITPDQNVQDTSN